MTKFKVGDRVRVRSWTNMFMLYGEDEEGNIKTPGGFSKDDERYCGKIGKVTMIHENGSFGTLYGTDITSCVSFYGEELEIVKESKYKKEERKYAVHTPTQEEYDRLMEAYEKVGWIDFANENPKDRERDMSFDYISFENKFMGTCELNFLIISVDEAIEKLKEMYPEKFEIDDESEISQAFVYNWTTRRFLPEKESDITNNLTSPKIRHKRIIKVNQKF